ncbi:MAG: type IV secretion system protein [Pseudomonadota bacterium]
MEAKSATQFFAECVNFDESYIDDLKKSARNWRTFAAFGWTVAVIGVVASVSMVSIHQFVPVIAKVDRLTGTADVSVGLERVNMADPKNERMMIADLIRYTKAREGFTRGEAESNYVTVWVMSDPSLRGDWDKEYRADLNPQALINTMGVKDQIKLVNISVSFLPTDSPKYRMVQVRYDKEKRVGAGDPTTQRFVSSYTFNYDVDAIPTTAEGIAVNFAGFQALNYRRDKESEETFIRPANAILISDAFPRAPVAANASAGSAK